MSFFSLLLAFLIEQVRPLGRNNLPDIRARGWLRWVVRKLDAGEDAQGWTAWALAVVAPAALVAFVFWLLGPWLGFVWNVAVLYVTLGFRQFSHNYTAIRNALEAGNEAEARRLLAEWKRIETIDLPPSEIIRHVLEHSTLAAHRHVLGVMTWFLIGALFGFGPFGAVLYRMAELASRHWSHGALQSQSAMMPVSAAAQSAARRAWQWLDWLPARITALGFAATGSFEDVVDAWRHYEPPADGKGYLVNDGLITTAAAAALHVRLGKTGGAATGGGTDAGDGHAETISATGFHREQTPQLAHLRSLVGLLWRSVVLWMFLLALLTLTRLVG